MTPNTLIGKGPTGTREKNSRRARIARRVRALIADGVLPVPTVTREEIEQ